MRARPLPKAGYPELYAFRPGRNVRAYLSLEDKLIELSRPPSAGMLVPPTSDPRAPFWLVNWFHVGAMALNCTAALPCTHQGFMGA